MLTLSTAAFTVTEVSLQCGFSSVTHFGRLFKQVYGLSPRDALRGR